MTNYICINGKKAELTEEQMKALGIELPKASPFERVKKRKQYYVIDPYGAVSSLIEDDDSLDIRAFNIGNYCTDKSLMEQRALHETFTRLLWRYSMEHDGDKIDWSTRRDKWFITYDCKENRFVSCNCQFVFRIGGVYFASREIANKAIEEIAKPFIAAHPDFKF